MSFDANSWWTNQSAADRNLMTMLGTGGAGANPLISGGMSLLGGIGDMLTESPQEKYYKWLLQAKKSVLADIKNIPEGDYLSEGDIVKEGALKRGAMKPTLDKMAFNAAGKAGIQSPEFYRMMGESVMPALMGSEAGLRDESRQLGFQRTMRKYGLMAGLV